MTELHLSYAAVIAAVALSLAGCGETAVKTVQPEVQPPTVAVKFAKKQLIAPNTYAVVFTQDASRDGVEVAARNLCGSRQWCQVLGWNDAAVAARAMPMTDREVEAQTFALTINRASGMDEVIWAATQ